MQFQIQTLAKLLPTEKDGVVRYLSGVNFPGIGKKTAEKIVVSIRGRLFIVDT